ncbi:MAG: SDR family oxidoreductase [Actinomycetota bacterium]|nr:SDR family oxidoreductase [Actinomycetota bacterium]
MVHSSAARATVEGLTCELAERWRGDGIAVVAAAAGHFRTRRSAKHPRSGGDAAAQTVPLQRLGRPEEHAWLVALLASPLGLALPGCGWTAVLGSDRAIVIGQSGRRPRAEPVVPGARPGDGEAR